MNDLYKAVFFDLDGTLHIPTPSPTDAFILFARRLDIVIDPVTEQRVKLWAHHYWSQHEQIRRDMRRSGDDFWIYYSQLLLKAVGALDRLEENARVIHDCFAEEYTPQVTLPPSARRTLATLKQHDYTLGLVSNRSNPLDDAVDELQLTGFFEVVLAAGEVGHWKPNPVIFEHALAQVPGLLPEQCLYVGDNYYADGHGAKAAGMRPVLFDPGGIYHDDQYERICRMDELLTLLEIPSAA